MFSQMWVKPFLLIHCQGRYLLYHLAAHIIFFFGDACTAFTLSKTHLQIIPSTYRLRKGPEDLQQSLGLGVHPPGSTTSLVMPQNSGS